ncbi:hypothetical protein CSQ93_06420 [Janthinobacterium sp. BJB426]|uniref:HET-C-related protein n=1 Tax=Janthinobacterium sp. BJB426 TaxID=2048010 RepID=UPI000C10406A|nr:HET-C-related protein [Janthinobacterium sp. BJB426]PHV28797.1 hypothetical protein CSQ93_06420 [Janthinobacterium sp. BJB426]
MFNRFQHSLAIIFSLMAMGASAADIDMEKLQQEIPAAKDESISVICERCNSDFKISEHKILLDGLSSRKYVRQMQIALYMQDIVHQTASKAHFDNCDFSGAIAYIAQLKAELDEHAEAATILLMAKKPLLANLELNLAFLSLGQALHGIQDFYAHTNYVEINIDDASALSDFKVVKTWGNQAEENVKKWQEAGLTSGYVSWGTPKKCAAPYETHGEMAKDSKETDRGKKAISKFGNVTHFEVAQRLAKDASRQFILDVFAEWPLLNAVSQGTIKLDVLVDGRATVLR